MNETLTLLDGNKNQMVRSLPLLYIRGYLNDGALAHIAENTGLVFTPTTGGYEARPESSNQIARLFLTYNFKTRYYNNWDMKNTLVLKGDHHVGFDIDSVCVDCLKHNNVYTHDLKDSDRLAC